MEKEAYKKRIIDACLAALRETAANAKREMDDAQQQANDYGQPKDRYDSFRTKLLRTRDMFAKQYSVANENIKHLEELNPNKLLDKVAYGSIVITDKQHLFIVLGLGKIMVDDTAFYVISLNVPIYGAMKDRKKGETFTFNGVTHKIQDIFWEVYALITNCILRNERKFITFVP